jgi:pimeloyl-ACP methyl ester carboxylesterase
MLQVILVLMLIYLLFVAFTLVSGRYLIRRRRPDPVDHPREYGLPWEAVQFPSRYKVTLRGWWIPAPHSKRAIIFCHGQNGSMEGDLPQVSALHQAGYPVLLFNLRAHGTSEGKTVTFGVFEKEDLLGAIDFVHTEKGIQKVAVLGFSMGAGIALISAALTDKIAALVLDGAFLRFVDTLEAWLRRRFIPPPLSMLLAQLMVFGASLQTNTRMYQVSPRLWARHVAVPTLLIHGEKDHLVPQKAVEKLAADLRGSAEIWVAPDSDHREAYKKHPDDYNRRVLAFFEKHLG